MSDVRLHCQAAPHLKLVWRRENAWAMALDGRAIPPNDPRRLRLAVTSERRADEPWGHDRTRTQKHPLPRAPTPSLDEMGE